jgi:hypothetical protein
MRQTIRVLVALLAVTIAAGASIASAQDEVKGTVQFAFNAGGKTYQPGPYTFRVNEQKMVVEIEPTTGATGIVLIETRLSQPEPPISQGQLVFDKVGATHYLSELWVPGNDGYLLNTTKDKHAHVKVKLSK